MSKPLPILAHMPWNVKRQIVIVTDTYTKFALRQCSKEFRGFVNSSKIEYEHLKLYWDSDKESVSVRLVVNKTDFKTDKSKIVDFDSCPNATLRKIGTSECLLVNKNYIDEGVSQFAKLLANPNVVFNRLSIDFRVFFENEERYAVGKKRLLEKLAGILNSFSHRIAVKEFNMTNDSNPNDILQMLTYLQPGFLKDIWIFPGIPLSKVADAEADYLDVSEIVETEQWKRAKNVDLTTYEIDVPREKTAHLSKLNCFYRKDLDEVKYIIENILRDNGWTHRSDRSGWFDHDEINQYLSQFEELPRDCYHRQFIIRRGDIACLVETSCVSIEFSKVTEN